MGRPAASPKTLAQVETPALVVDLDALEHNIDVIAHRYQDATTKLRPHGKNHKCPEILRRQIEAGGTVGGVCAAKVSEAEVFARSGVISNVLIANQIVDAAKIERLCALAHEVDVMVAVDDAAQVRRLEAGARAHGRRLGIVIEVDTMMGRGGVRDAATAVQLAEQVSQSDVLEFRGVMSHQVPTVPSPNKQQRFEEGLGYIDHVLSVKHAIEAAGITMDTVSTGETWTYDVAMERPEVTEIEGGTYIVMEVPYNYMQEFRYAARLMGRIVERPDATHAIGDITIDAIGAPNGLPTLDGLPGVEVTKLDHAGIHLQGADAPLSLEVGDPFFVLTHQQDITMNRWDYYLGVRGDVVETVFEASARGCVH